ncbi:hypothetical protein [Stenotrophomonas sp.]|uniref:hypothetical protein n=1 Tax=Stenotrophomonas sp. TaxID=69392 RepID=UPI0028AABC75|nr:hypothetical protein [Stenotrophomonas sp.]
MSQLRLLRNNALFHGRRVLPGLILFGMALATGCTSEGVAVAASPAKPPLTTSQSAPPTEQRAVRYLLTAVAVDEAPSRPGGQFPFILSGSGSEHAQVLDQNREIIRSAPVGGTIFSLRISKNKKWALIYFGDAGYAIASAETFEDIARPPIRPDGFEDATWFRWLILDDDHLIGQATLPSLDPGVGMTLSEKDSLPPRDTLIYIYTISSGTTTRAEIDGTLPRPFRISEDTQGRLLILSLDDLEKFGAKIVQIPEP